MRAREGSVGPVIRIHRDRERACITGHDLAFKAGLTAFVFARKLVKTSCAIGSVYDLSSSTRCSVRAARGQQRWHFSHSVRNNSSFLSERCRATQLGRL